MNAAEQLRALIAESGPVGFDAAMRMALYDTDHGFYEAGGRAGRRGGDFITSPEVGPLFGAVIARALDEWWRAAGSPARFCVVEAASGRGTLARTIQVADPECLVALDYVMVDASATQRELSEGIGAAFRTDVQLPDRADVILANELLDNLPFRVGRLSEAGEWNEVLIDTSAAGRFKETVSHWSAPLPDAMTQILRTLNAAVGTDVPLAVSASRWVSAATAVADRVVCFDYGARTAELIKRPDRGWLRCYRDNERGELDFSMAGSQDITTDVPVDQLPEPTRISTQEAWLRGYGIDELVAEGRQIWQNRAGVGDLAAIRARSRAVEAEALLDPIGLGGFVVLEWESKNTLENSLI